MHPTSTPTICCFAPITHPDAKVLILGSMPGKESLRAGQYYAHPRNAFWKIMGELAGFSPDLPYEQRVRSISDAGIAVWDVLASCRRSSSLDSDIDAASLVANDLAAFFRSHPNIQWVYFNGAMAEKSFHAHVLPHLDTQSLHFQRLPSTSPAHASLSYEQKLADWRIVIQS